jgi:hypothetical protein
MTICGEFSAASRPFTKLKSLICINAAQYDSAIKRLNRPHS